MNENYTTDIEYTIDEENSNLIDSYGANNNNQRCVSFITRVIGKFISSAQDYKLYADDEEFNRHLNFILEAVIETFNSGYSDGTSPFKD